MTREMRLKDDIIVALVRVREGSGCFKAALVLMNGWGCDGNIGDGYILIPVPKSEAHHATNIAHENTGHRVGINHAATAQRWSQIQCLI